MPPIEADAVFSSNTLHIVSWSLVRLLFERVGALLPANGMLAVYGPFKYGGAHTAPSNAQFDAMLRERDPQSGLRDLEAVDDLAKRHGFAMLEDNPMPANNRTVVWVKRLPLAVSEGPAADRVPPTRV